VGPALGVIAIESFTYVFSDQFPEIWPILLGLLLLLVILVRPSGVISLFVGERERMSDFRPRSARPAFPVARRHGNAA
ncbi:MAG: hypothetical protein ACREF1_00315, partial [Acetobacteraceae bacterium]